MPLTQASLSTKIQTEIINIYGAAQSAAKLKQFADAIAKAVVDEIQANAVVNVTGVQSGPNTATGTVT